MKKDEGTDEKIKKIYRDVQKDWHLCGKLLNDFVSVSLIEFKNENKLPDFNDKILEDFSKDLFNRIYGGMGHYLGKFGVSHLNMILKRWIEQSIDDEVKRRIKESTNNIKEDCPKNDGINPNDAVGGIMYV